MNFSNWLSHIFEQKALTKLPWKCKMLCWKCETSKSKKLVHSKTSVCVQMQLGQPDKLFHINFWCKWCKECECPLLPHFESEIATFCQTKLVQLLNFCVSHVGSQSTLTLWCFFFKRTTFLSSCKIKIWHPVLHPSFGLTFENGISWQSSECWHCLTAHNAWMVWGTDLMNLCAVWLAWSTASLWIKPQHCWKTRMKNSKS